MVIPMTETALIVCQVVCPVVLIRLVISAQLDGGLTLMETVDANDVNTDARDVWTCSAVLNLKLGITFVKIAFHL
jgi:hypothetical protein